MYGINLKHLDLLERGREDGDRIIHQVNQLLQSAETYPKGESYRIFAFKTDYMANDAIQMMKGWWPERHEQGLVEMQPFRLTDEEAMQRSGIWKKMEYNIDVYPDWANTGLIASASLKIDSYVANPVRVDIVPTHGRKYVGNHLGGEFKEGIFAQCLWYEQIEGEFTCINPDHPTETKVLVEGASEDELHAVTRMMLNLLGSHAAYGQDNIRYRTTPERIEIERRVWPNIDPEQHDIIRYAHRANISMDDVISTTKHIYQAD